MASMAASGDDFTRDLFDSFETIDRGGILWTADSPLPRDWFTGDASFDLERVTDLLCEADVVVLRMRMRGEHRSKCAEFDQLNSYAASLADLRDFLSAVVETLHAETVQA